MPGINRNSPAIIYFDGSPEGIVDADFNTLCVDQSSPTIWRKTTLLHTLTGWQVVTQSAFKLMANGDIRMFVEDSTGKLAEKVIPKGNSGVLGTDSSGNLTLVSASSLMTTQVVPKAGTVTLALADAGTKTVTFATAFSAGTTYNVVIHYNGLALIYTVTASSVTAFTFSFLSTLSGTAYWTATPITG